VFLRSRSPARHRIVCVWIQLEPNSVTPPRSRQSVRLLLALRAKKKSLPLERPSVAPLSTLAVAVAALVRLLQMLMYLLLHWFPSTLTTISCLSWEFSLNSSWDG
jgi:hypothetical protein